MKASRDMIKPEGEQGDGTDGNSHILEGAKGRQAVTAIEKAAAYRATAFSVFRRGREEKLW
jgi:hypothetical protein